MELTEEMLQQIEQLASIYMPIRDIALIIEVEETASARLSSRGPLLPPVLTAKAKPSPRWHSTSRR